MSSSNQALVARAKSYLNSQSLRSAGQAAAKSLSPEAWMKESHALSQQAVYTTILRSAVVNWENGSGRTPDPQVSLSQSYRSNARTIADRRAVEAGFRLAAILEGLF